VEFDFLLLPGDYVGPEVTAEAVKVVDEVGKKFGHVFRWHRDEIGGASIDAYGVPLRDETIALARDCDAILFGAAGGPKWDDPKGGRNQSDTALLKLRKALDLYANLRIVKVFPALTDASTLKPEVIEGVDLIILRELTSGLYFGQPKEIWQTPEGRKAVDTMSYTEAEITRILRVGFELARARSRRLLSVDKSNVLETGRLWRQIAMELSSEYPDVELRHMYVDAAAMVLVRDPKSIDVVVMENTFGDILSDEAAMLAGSLGMLPSASLAGPPLGGVFGLYEPIHGSDPPHAGKLVNNPLAAILSGALMLRFSCQLEREAHAVEQACSRVLDQGYRTWDIMQPGRKQIGTREMGDLVAGALGTT
jgi:3-isopropylmalate dehydrogenase